MGNPKKNKSKESFIEAIYIFNNSGICLLSCSSNPNSVSENLAAGFFTAIKEFGKELIPGAGVESLVMSGHKLFYNDYENITFAIQSSIDLPNQIIYYILDEISDKFLIDYKDVIPAWKGNVTIFDDFKNYLLTFLEKPLIEKILDDFGYKLHAEGMIVFDKNQDKILFAKLPQQFASQRQKSMGGMLVNFAKNLSDEFKGGNVNSILISTENKWICVAKRENIYITVLFPKKRDIELTIIINKTEETLNHLLNLLQI
ncbi:MAG: hypothetical protein HWN67_04710 [Candidatus Helarchaeota archaeon]|nr:hypothetical protein [Candidatus Helarchaeota archaeon]